MYGTHFSKAALLLVPLACLALAAALRRHFPLVLAAAASVFVAATLLTPSSVAGDPPRRPPGTPQPSGADRPVILHLVLDEHIGIDGLPQELPETRGFASWLIESYLQAGFRIYSGAYSEYFDTRNSIANLLNFTSDAGSWSHLARGQKKPYVLTESAYFGQLGKLGYRLHAYTSDHIDLCRVPGVTYAGCVHYRSNSIGALTRTKLAVVERARFIFNSFLATSQYLERAGTILHKLTGYGWPSRVSRVGPIAVLPVLQRLEADLRFASRGQAYFAHLLIPHYPYVLDESCGVRGQIEQWLYNVPAGAGPGKGRNTEASRAERYRRYFEQIRCQQALLQRLFDALKEAGVWEDAIVVVHGDHGSRIVRKLPSAANAARLTAADLNDAFSTLFTVRKAGLKAGVQRAPRPLQELLAEAFDVPIGPLPPRIYLRAEDGGLMPLPLDTSPALRLPDGR